MAFGDLLSSASNSSTSPGTSLATSAAATVAVGNLVVVAFGIKGAPLTSFGFSDNLGNVWTNLTGGDTAAGVRTLQKAYSIITVAGSCTVTAAWTGSTTSDAAIVVACFEGPFAASPLDADPAVINDGTSPYTSPSSGTLSQADELIIATYVATNGEDSTATSPNVARIQAKSGTGANTASAGLGSWVVAATTAVAPEWTGAVGHILGTTTFKKGSSFSWYPMDELGLSRWGRGALRPALGYMADPINTTSPDVSGWAQRWLEPVRRPNVPRGAVDNIIDTSSPLVSGWYQRWLEPVRNKPRPSFPMVMDAGGTNAPSVAGWFYRWLEPVRNKPRPSFPMTVDAINTDSPLVSGWFYRWLEPVRNKPRPAFPMVMDPGGIDAASVSGWFQRWLEPVRNKPRPAFPMTVDAINTDSPLVSGWFQRWLEPVRNKARPAFPQTIDPINTSSPDVSGWFYRWDDPVRRPSPRAKPSDFWSMLPEPTVPDWGWYMQWPIIIRRKARPTDNLVIGNDIPAPAQVTVWGPAWIDMVHRRNQVSTWSVYDNAGGFVPPAPGVDIHNLKMHADTGAMMTR